MRKCLVWRGPYCEWRFEGAVVFHLCWNITALLTTWTLCQLSDFGSNVVLSIAFCQRRLKRSSPFNKKASKKLLMKLTLIIQYSCYKILFVPRTMSQHKFHHRKNRIHSWEIWKDWLCGMMHTTESELKIVISWENNKRMKKHF